MLLGGAILTETVFAWPGVGKWLFDAVMQRDYMVIQGGTLFVADHFVVVNLVVDVLYAVINPRISVRMTGRIPKTATRCFDQLSQFLRNKTAVAGRHHHRSSRCARIFAPWLSPHDPIENALYEQLKPPVWDEEGSTNNLLGTDDLGRDILSRIIYGARVSLLVAW